MCIWCIEYHYSFAINLIKFCIVLLTAQLGFPLARGIFPFFLCFYVNMNKFFEITTFQRNSESIIFRTYMHAQAALTNIYVD